MQTAASGFVLDFSPLSLSVSDMFAIRADICTCRCSRLYSDLHWFNESSVIAVH
jgi:hypothetical protein